MLCNRGLGTRALLCTLHIQASDEPHVPWARFCSRVPCVVEALSAAWMFQDSALCVDGLNGAAAPRRAWAGAEWRCGGPRFIAGFCVCAYHRRVRETRGLREELRGCPGRHRTRLCGEGLGLLALAVGCSPRGQGLVRLSAGGLRVLWPGLSQPPPLQRCHHLLGCVWRSCVHYRSEVALWPEKGPCWGTEDTTVLLQPLALVSAAVTSGSDLNQNGFVGSLSEAETVAAGCYGDWPLCGRQGGRRACLTPLSPAGLLRERTGPARRQQEGAGLPLQVPVGPRALRGPALPAGEQLTADTLLAPPAGQGRPPAYPASLP